MITPAGAQAVQDDATGRGTWLAWIITNADLEYPDCFVGRAHTADRAGGRYLPGTLVANTLDELRAMLPGGLKCHARTSIDPPDVLEVWD